MLKISFLKNVFAIVVAEVAKKGIVEGTWSTDQQAGRALDKPFNIAESLSQITVAGESRLILYNSGCKTTVACYILDTGDAKGS